LHQNSKNLQQKRPGRESRSWRLKNFNVNFNHLKLTNSVLNLESLAGFAGGRRALRIVEATACGAVFGHAAGVVAGNF
jgi:hypothetical protein